MAPYGAPQVGDVIGLNVNENPFAPSPELITAIADAAATAARELNRYPDREAAALRADLGAYLAADAGSALPAERIWVANGSNEALHHCYAAFGGPGRRVLTCEPTYSMYPEYARETFTEQIHIPRNPDFTLNLEAIEAAMSEYQPALVVIATPNNPTGTLTSVAELATIAQWLPDGMLIVDEAYAEFRDSDVPSALTMLNEYPNLIVSRTMSKAFGLAGARVGYLAADPAVVDALRVVRLPYHLSSITQAIARAALGFAGELQGQIAILRRERDALAEWLVDQHLTVIPSQANFLMFGRFADRDGLWQALLDRRVLIRQVLDRDWLRVSIGTPEQNAIFRDALADVLPQFDWEGST